MKKYPKEAKLQCPTCLGDGYVEVKNYHAIRYFGKYTDLRNKIRRLGEKKVNDLSLREVGKAIGYPLMSAQSVKHHLGQVKKLGWDIER